MIGDMSGERSKSANPTTRLQRASSAPHRPRLIVLGYGQPTIVAEQLARLRPLIESHAEVVLVDLGEYRDLSEVDADYAVVLGGDGAILRAAKQMAYRQLPVLGVNLGRLGFLADLTPEEFVELLPTLAAGKLSVVEHLMFECSLVRGERVLEKVLGLNEAAVLGGSPFAILDIHLYVDAELVTTYSCDGLIVSTPVGSTAHNLSAGGPILRKDLQAFVISPISPHTLTNRPVVDSANRVFELILPRPLEGTAVVVDGRVMSRLEPNDRIRIERAAPQFKLVEARGHGYYRTLREKLGWGGSNTRRREP
jgi:NAD+ kinase